MEAYVAVWGWGYFFCYPKVSAKTLQIKSRVLDSLLRRIPISGSLLMGAPRRLALVTHSLLAGQPGHRRAEHYE